MEIFIERLKELRAEQHLSQKQIATLLGICQQPYAQYESGRSEPSLRMLAKLSEIFHVSTDYLLGLKDY